MPVNLLIYLISFVFLWIGANLAISAVEKLARSLRFPIFSLSFLVLGFLTSLSEFAVGLSAVIDKDPEIYVGNLIGASIVIFTLIIPLLAITGKGLNVAKAHSGWKLTTLLAVIALPTILSLDGRVNRLDSLISIFAYALIAIAIELQSHPSEVLDKIIKINKANLLKQLGLIAVGLALIFLASHFIVEETIYFSQILKLSPFVISLLAISLGTNLPEISMMIKASFGSGKQAAFGDYLGSAAFNTFLFGFLTLLHGQDVVLTNSYYTSLIVFSIILVTFYIFSKSQRNLSRREGLLLLLGYLVFLFMELSKHLT